MKAHSRKIPVASLDWVAAAAAAVAALVLWKFDPTAAGSYPSCPLHQWTGWACPGCGSLRALHQLLHGNALAAIDLNPLLIASLPLAAVLFIGTWERRCQWNSARPGWRWGFCLTVVIYGLVRNVWFHSPSVI